MSVDWYILDANGEPVKTTMEGWVEWTKFHRAQGTDPRIVAQTNIPFGHGALVSTVFLGLDHSFGGPPILYETMVFDHRKVTRRYEYEGKERKYERSEDYWQQRYRNRADALVGHERVVEVTAAALKRGEPLSYELYEAAGC